MIQRDAKLSLILAQLPHEERFSIMEMTKMEDRRERGDLIMTLSVVKGIGKVGKEEFFIRECGRTYDMNTS